MTERGEYDEIGEDQVLTVDQGIEILQRIAAQRGVATASRSRPAARPASCEVLAREFNSGSAVAVTTTWPQN